MADDKKSIEELEKIWDDMVRELFVEFNDKYLHVTAEGDNGCIGSGDSLSYCAFCRFQMDC